MIVYIVITMMFSAFFSGMEIAYVSSNRMLAEMNNDDEGVSGRIVTFFYKHPNTYVNTMLVGNNIALVIYGILIAELFNSTIFANQPEAFSVTADTIISTIIVLFTGEYLPKTIFKNNANRLLSFFAIPAWICYAVLYPISKFCTLISRLMLKMLGITVKKTGQKEEFSKVDLDYLVAQSLRNQNLNGNSHDSDGDSSHDSDGDDSAVTATNSDDDSMEVKIFQNALDLSETKVRDCMIPRTEITCIEKGASLDELRQKFIESGRSKIIVYKEDIDHITGYIHSSELFRIKKGWESHVHHIPFVPETMSAKKLMENLLSQKTSLAVVVDEFGGTSGLVSLEDIVEEIIGEIEDEHDISNYECRQTSDGGYLVSARMEIERVNETLGIELPESDEYKTVSGLILTQYQSFPKLHEIIEFNGWKCQILKNTATKIELVKLTRIEN